MATRMQQRRGTAEQWTSTNGGNGPILNMGEIGWESDTNKFKIGDGQNHWAALPYFLDEDSLGGSLGDYLTVDDLGQPLKAASLDADGKIPVEQLGNIIDGAPGLLDTLNELSAALGNDADFAANLTTTLGNKQDKVSGVSDTEIGYLSGVTSDIQTQIDGKLASADLDEAAQEAVNTALVAGTGLDKTYDDLNNTITLNIDSTVATKTYADDAANAAQAAAELTASGALSTHSSDTTSVHGITDTAELATKAFAAELLTNATKTNIAITGDKNGLTITAENGVADSTTSDLTEGTNLYFTDERAQDAVGNAVGTGLTYTDSTGAISVTPNTYDAYGSAAAITASTLGLGNVDNTSDADKPVSTATQTALDAQLALAGGTMTGDLSLAGTPTQALHAATKSYVDAVSEGLHIHASVVAATTANVAIATDLEPGDLVDGVTLAEGSRVLVKSQTNAAQNGIYVVQASGAALRASDFNEPLEVDGGDFIFVTGGDTHDNTGWVQTTDNVVTIGTDPIEFTQFSGAGTYLAGTGLELTDSLFSIDTATTVDISTAQTLTNKTISAASNTLTIATTDLTDVTATAAEVNVLDGITATTTELNYVDGVTSAIQTQLDDKQEVLIPGTGLDVTGANISIDNAELSNYLLDGVSGSSYGLIGTSAYLDVKNTNGYNKEIELDIAAVKTQLNTDGYLTTSSTSTLTNKTLTSPKINEDVALTATATELNYVDGVTSAIQTQLDNKLSLESETSQTITGTVIFSSTTADLKLPDKVKDSLGNYSSAGKVLGRGQFGAAWVTPRQAGIWPYPSSAGQFLTTDADGVASWTSNPVPAVSSSTTLNSATAFSIDVVGASLSSTINMYGYGNYTSTDAAVFNNAFPVGTSVTISGSGQQTTFTVTGAATIQYGTIDANITVTSPSGYTSNYGNGDTFTMSATASQAGKYLTNDGTSTSWGTIDLSSKQDVVSGVSDTEIGYLDGVTSAIQTQLDGKASLSSPVLVTPDLKGRVEILEDDSNGLPYNPPVLDIGGRLVLSTSGITFEGNTANDYETTISVVDPTADRTINFPNVSGTVVTTGNIADALPSQSLNGGKYLTTDGSSASWAELSVPITITATGSASTNSENLIDLVSTSDFTSIDYSVLIKQGSKVRTSKVTVQTDGTSVDYVEYGVLETGGTIAGVSVYAVYQGDMLGSYSRLNVIVTDGVTTPYTVKFSKVVL